MDALNEDFGYVATFGEYILRFAKSLKADTIIFKLSDTEPFEYDFVKPGIAKERIDSMVKSMIDSLNNN
jgi:hypothetical protein